MTSEKKNPTNNWKRLGSSKKQNPDFGVLMYFVNAYKKYFGVEYSYNRGQDLHTIKRLRADLKRASIDEGEVKQFLAWMLEASTDERSSNLPTLQQYKDYIPGYLERDKAAVKQGDYDPTFVARLKSDCGNKLIKDLLVQYGIPIVATMFAQLSGDEKVARANIKRTMTRLFNAGETNILLKIARQSINLSPYPEGCIMRPWRKIFAEIWEELRAKKKTWWRQRDYSDRPVPRHYKEMIDL